MIGGVGWSPTATTRLVALLGWPARHSLSPVMHNAAFREQGLDLVYVALPVLPERLVDVVAALGHVEVLGANVTVPHKEAVARTCDRLTAEAELLGAVNTLVWAPGGLVGDNTDAVGFAAALDGLGAPRGGVSAVVFGAGGAARAAAAALARTGFDVVVAARRGERAREVADVAARAGAPTARAIGLDEASALARVVRDAWLVCNATPLGMAGEAVPAPFADLHPGQVALDLVYGPRETPFLVAARAAGATAHHGIGMLVAQAAASYERWTGQAPPVATMSAAALAALTAQPHPTA